MIGRILMGLIVGVVLSLVANAQACDIQVYFGSPEQEDGAIVVLLQSIDAALGTLEIAVVGLTDDRLGDAVVRAYRRGVNVRVILASGRETEAGSEWEKLLAVGVPVRLSDPTASFQHRFAIIDGRTVLIGSRDWMERPLSGSFDGLVRITCPSPGSAAVRAFVSEFDRLWSLFDRAVSTAAISSPLSPVSVLSVDTAAQCVILLNASDVAVELSRWTLSDLEGGYTFPEGTTLLPNDPLRICSDVFNPTNDHDELWLDPSHDEVFLISPEGDILNEFVW